RAQPRGDDDITQRRLGEHVGGLRQDLQRFPVGGNLRHRFNLPGRTGREVKTGKLQSQRPKSMSKKPAISSPTALPAGAKVERKSATSAGPMAVMQFAR